MRRAELPQSFSARETISKAKEIATHQAKNHHPFRGTQTVLGFPTTERMCVSAAHLFIF